MSRLNWIIQRSTDGELQRPGASRLGNWRDCHSVSNDGVHIYDENRQRGLTTDAHGNKGFQDKKKARKEMERMRKKFPHDHYRMIKITE